MQLFYGYDLTQEQSEDVCTEALMSDLYSSEQDFKTLKERILNILEIKHKESFVNNLK